MSQVHDAHRLAHVEDEQFSTLPHAAGLQDQVHGLGVVMKYRFISGWVIVTGPPRSICALNNGTTLPRLPRTLPNLTTMNGRPERRAASRTSMLAIRFDAPMMPVGETALSVEIATNRFVPDRRAASTRISVPRTLFEIASS